MPRTQISCPNCRQPIAAEIDQLFDVAADPSAKQRLLSGMYNLVDCPYCRFQGNAATVIVYHDSEKELLLTYVPAEIGLPRDEQERVIGSLINQVINKLPQEKRKGYLLRPQPSLTMQGLMERILEADGITKEMIQSQQKRLNLIQRMLGITDPQVLQEVAAQEDQLIDSEFFGLLRSLTQAAMMGGDQDSAQKLESLQNDLLPITTFGREMQSQAREIESAIQQLQAAGKDLTREKLLELLIKAPNDTQLGVIVSLTRPAIDYSFFQMLSERIDRARADGRARLVQLREKLLEITAEIDRQVAARSAEARKTIENLRQSPDIEQAMLQILPSVDEFFVQELDRLIETARKQGDLEQLAQYQKMTSVIQEASEAPPEVALIEELLDVPEGGDQTESWRRVLSTHKEQVTPEFLSTLASITAQVQSGDNPELARRLTELNRVALRYSMERNL